MNMKSITRSIEYQLHQAQERFIRNRIVDVVAFDKPCSSPNLMGTVRFKKYLK